MPLVIDRQTIFDCCSCSTFASTLASKGPFQNVDALIDASRITWWQETPLSGWLEAFAAHPRIGDTDSLRQKFSSFAEFSKGEQSSAVSSASEETLQELSRWNRLYEDKFGHIFIICAAGKSAQHMLDALTSRYTNEPLREISVAASEQQKITELRLIKTLSSSAGQHQAPALADRRAGQILHHLRGMSISGNEISKNHQSPITTHVLDTCLGRPAPYVKIQLHKLYPGSFNVWDCIAEKQTNQDGRVPDLLPPSNSIDAGMYRITFDTTEYMARCKRDHPTFFADCSFYPTVMVHFTISPSQTQQHFHVPLTWNPYGYSTYRGS